MSSIKTLLKFESLLKKFNSIYRDLESLHTTKQRDNDIEHSYRVAMLCWMLIDEYNFKLDKNKVIRYALLHDLPEVYAGDTSLYASQAKKAKAKKNETRAIGTLIKKFPKQKSLWKDLQEYEERENAESRFVYMIEKLEPGLVILLAPPGQSIKRKASFEWANKEKQKKIGHIDTVAQLFNKDLTDYLTKNKKKFWKYNA